VERFRADGERLAAQKELLELGDAAIPALVSGLSDAERLVRIYSVLTLEHLARLLTGPDAGPQAAAESAAAPSVPASGSLFRIGAGLDPCTRLAPSGDGTSNQPGAAAADALDAYLSERGEAPGPLLRNARGGRLSVRSLYTIVRDRARAAGTRVRSRAACGSRS
jgi:hypothetical protein